MYSERLNKLLKMQEESPDDPFFCYALGMEYLGTKDIDTAEKYFKECISIDPNQTAAYYQLALICREQGREEEALQSLESGLLLLKKSGDQKTINEFRTLIEDIRF